MDKILQEILDKNFTKSGALLALSSLRAEVTEKLYGDKKLASVKGLKRDNATETLNKIQKQIEEIEPLFVTLAIDLPDEKLAELAGKLRKTFGNDLLFEFKTDPKILAGCQLVWQGKLVDYSWRSKFAASKPIIIETINAFKSN